MALATEINKVVNDPITVDDAQMIIDGIARKFPTAWKWLEDNAERAVRDEKLQNAFGAYRYFQGASELSDSDQAGVKREAKNYPMQGNTAMLLAQAGNLLYKALRGDYSHLDMNILLPIHDAFLFEVRRDQVLEALQLIVRCMADDNTMPGNGRHLGVDLEIMEHSWADNAFTSAEAWAAHIAA